MENLRFLSYNKIDKEKWDLCIQKSINRKIYAFSWYLDVVSETWDGLIYGDYELVFPIVSKKRFLFKKIYHPLFCQQLGPFSSNQNLLYNKDVLCAILNFLDKKYWKFEFSINHSFATIYKKNIADYYKDFNYFDRINLELNLNSSYQDILSNYSTNHKRSLKKKIDISVHYEHQCFNQIDDQEIHRLVSVYKAKIGIQLSLKNQDYIIIESLIKTLRFHKSGFFLSLKNDSNELLAGAFFSSFFNRDILMFNFSDLSLKFNSMLFLIDAYIKTHSNTERILDFEGSNLPVVKRFYRGLGAVEKNYIHIIK